MDAEEKERTRREAEEKAQREAEEKARLGAPCQSGCGTYCKKGSSNPEDCVSNGVPISKNRRGGFCIDVLCISS